MENGAEWQELHREEGRQIWSKCHKTKKSFYCFFVTFFEFRSLHSSWSASVMTVF
uniref:Uncharacterized protein n=1 Tax=Xiphophorus maculatus TaxID=8083 RepID=A0A3B5QUX1_XIPMA